VFTRIQQTDDERHLVELAKQGDRAAFDKLIKRYERQFYKCAYLLTENSADADDVMAGVLLRVWKALPGYRNEAAFTTWVYRIIANEASDLRTRRRRIVSLSAVSGSGEDHSTTLEDPTDHVAQIVDRIATTSLLNKLPTGYAKVLAMHFDDCDHETIALTLGISVVASRQHLYRGLKMLRTLVNAEMGKKQWLTNLPTFQRRKRLALHRAFLDFALQHDGFQTRPVVDEETEETLARDLDKTTLDLPPDEELVRYARWHLPRKGAQSNPRGHVRSHHGKPHRW